MLDTGSGGPEWKTTVIGVLNYVSVEATLVILKLCRWKVHFKFSCLFAVLL